MVTAEFTVRFSVNYFVAFAILLIPSLNRDSFPMRALPESPGSSSARDALDQILNKVLLVEFPSSPVASKESFLSTESAILKKSKESKKIPFPNESHESLTRIPCPSCPRTFLSSTGLRDHSIDAHGTSRHAQGIRALTAANYLESSIQSPSLFPSPSPVLPLDGLQGNRGKKGDGKREKKGRKTKQEKKQISDKNKNQIDVTTDGVNGRVEEKQVIGRVEVEKKMEAKIVSNTKEKNEVDSLQRGTKPVPRAFKRIPDVDPFIEVKMDALPPVEKARPIPATTTAISNDDGHAQIKRVPHSFKSVGRADMFDAVVPRSSSIPSRVQVAGETTSACVSDAKPEFKPEVRNVNSEIKIAAKSDQLGRIGGSKNALLHQNSSGYYANYAPSFDSSNLFPQPIPYTQYAYVQNESAPFNPIYSHSGLDPVAPMQYGTGSMHSYPSQYYVHPDVGQVGVKTYNHAYNPYVLQSMQGAVPKLQNSLPLPSSIIQPILSPYASRPFPVDTSAVPPIHSHFSNDAANATSNNPNMYLTQPRFRMDPK